MKYILFFFLLFNTLAYAENGFPNDGELQEFPADNDDSLLNINSSLNILVTGQGVAPSFATSPAQSYVLAKRAAIADAYRLMAERVNGVTVEGKDTIKNMSVQRSMVRTQVNAMIKNAVIIETTFQDGMCEVQLEINIKYSDF